MTETADRPLVEMPVPRADDPRLRAWIAFLRAYSAVTRKLEAELHAERDLGLAEYDALVQLALADDRRLRMSEFAERVVLSRSGVSRLVDRLETTGLVLRAPCMDDARVSWATLTDAGFARLRDASPVHLRGVETHFLAQIPDEDREALVRALETVVRGLRTRGTPATTDAAAPCAPPTA
jgi:DNA-binding MarR family transcriptional regulator